MLFWAIAVVASIAGLALLFLDARRRERAIERDWRLALTPRGEQVFREVESRMKAEAALTDLTYEKAFEAHAEGDPARALRMVDEGCRLIEHFAPTMIQALGAMAVLSRMVAAIAPVRPLRPKDFRVAQLVHLAHLGQFFHHLLIAGAERFRLRVYILQRGFRTLAALILVWTGGKQRHHAPEWERLREANSDVGTLTDESLKTFRVLLVSLAAEKR